MVVGVSSSIPVTGERSTSDDVEVDVGTTEGEPSIDVAASRKSYLPTCSEIVVTTRLKFASSTTLYLFFYALGTMTCYFY